MNELLTVFETFDSFEADRALAALSESKIIAVKTYSGVPNFRAGRTLNRKILIQTSASDIERAADVLKTVGILKV